jgi:hypothetical protein
MKTILLLILLLSTTGAFTQDLPLPYHSIPQYPENYTAGTVAARTIDGLGFRFYWATDGLRDEDLAYQPGAEARTTLQTIEHIYQMSFMIFHATTNTVNVTGQAPQASFADMRKKTLENLQTASQRLLTLSDSEVSGLKARFKRGDATTELPFWNMLNGPIADCLWHTGQIVSFRRASGNPFSNKVNVFYGTVN